MSEIVWGLNYDIQMHSQRELTVYLLFFAIVCLLMGRFVSGADIKNDYLSLIRAKGYALLWRKWWLKTMLVSMVITTCSFALFRILDMVFRLDVFGTGWYVSFVLWFLAISLIGSIFMLLQSFRNGQTIGFLLVVCVEVVSIYMSQLLWPASLVCVGNYTMLERSSYAGSAGYPLSLAIIVFAGIIVATGMIGYKIAYGRGER